LPTKSVIFGQVKIEQILFASPHPTVLVSYGYAQKKHNLQYITKNKICPVKEWWRAPPQKGNSCHIIHALVLHVKWWKIWI